MQNIHIVKKFLEYPFSKYLTNIEQMDFSIYKNNYFFKLQFKNNFDCNEGKHILFCKY